MTGLYNNNNNNRKLIHPVILIQWKYGHSPSGIIVFFLCQWKKRSFLDRNTSNTNSLPKKKHQLALTHIKKDLSLLINLFIDWHRGKKVLTFHFMSVMGNGHQCVLWVERDAHTTSVYNIYSKYFNIYPFTLWLFYTSTLFSETDPELKFTKIDERYKYKNIHFSITCRNAKITKNQNVHK